MFSKIKNCILICIHSEKNIMTAIREITERRSFQIEIYLHNFKFIYQKVGEKRNYFFILEIMHIYVIFIIYMFQAVCVENKLFSFYVIEQLIFHFMTDLS